MKRTIATVLTIMALVFAARQNSAAAPSETMNSRPARHHHHGTSTPTPTVTPTPTPTVTPTPTTTPTPAIRVEKGIGILGVPSPIPSYVDNLFIPVSAADINPAPGTFDFSSIDPAVSKATAAGKGFTLALYFGISGTPAWFYTQGGVQSLTVTEGTVPVPWDAAYLSYVGQIITAMGQQYNSNPYLASVKLGGLNLKSGEMHILESNTTVDNAYWLGIGYTAALIQDAFVAIQSDYSAAFPGVEQIAGILPDGGWPLTLTSNDPTLNNTLFALGGWYEQFDALSADLLPGPAQGMTCYQAISVLGTQLQAAINQVLAQPTANCLELYPQDVTDANASIIAAAGVTLKAR